jgi:hypothetical protein
MDEPNYTQAAFLHPWNLIFLTVGLSVAVGLGIATGLPVWLLIGFVLASELVVLGTVPRNERFQRVVRADHRAERLKPPTKEEKYKALTRRQQRRYARLRTLCTEIESNYASLNSASQQLVQRTIRKLDNILDSYLDLLHQRNRHREAIDSATENSIQKSIASLEDRLDDMSDRVRTVKERRLKVLKRRLARFEKAHENLDVIEAQLQTVEDVAKYIHEQSYTLQNPDEITHQLDALFQEVEEAQEHVREIENVFSDPDSYLDDMDEMDDIDWLDEDEEPLSAPEPRSSESDKSGPARSSRTQA